MRSRRRSKIVGSGRARDYHRDRERTPAMPEVEPERVTPEEFLTVWVSENLTHDRFREWADDDFARALLADLEAAGLRIFDAETTTARYDEVEDTARGLAHRHNPDTAIAAANAVKALREHLGVVPRDRRSQPGVQS